MNRKPLILVSLLLAAFVINLDTTIVNVALPSLVRQLHASNSQLQWVVDAYNLVFAGSVLAAGSLSDRFGRKGMLLAGLSVFGLASLAGGLMNSPGQLIAARAVMGLGAAMVFPSTLSLISNVFTRAGRARARHRPVGRDRGRGDRARSDRRGLAARGLGLAQHLLRHGADRRRRRRPRLALRAHVAGSGRAAHRPHRVRAVGRRDRTARLHDHRGAEPRLVEHADDRGLRADRGPGRRVRGLGAAHRAPDARREPVRQPAVHRRERRRRDLVLRAVGLHLPGHPALPVPPGLRPALHRRAPAAGGDVRRDLVDRRGPARGPGRARSWSSPPGCS